MQEFSLKKILIHVSAMHATLIQIFTKLYEPSRKQFWVIWSNDENLSDGILQRISNKAVARERSSAREKEESESLMSFSIDELVFSFPPPADSQVTGKRCWRPFDSILVFLWLRLMTVISKRIQTKNKAIHKNSGRAGRKQFLNHSTFNDTCYRIKSLWKNRKIRREKFNRISKRFRSRPLFQLHYSMSNQTRTTPDANKGFSWRLTWLVVGTRRNGH